MSNHRHFKFRPPYNMPVRGNAKLYWNYALDSTLYYLKKQKKEKTQRTKRSKEMLELSQLYLMNSVNEHYERASLSQRMLSDLNIHFDTIETLRARTFHLEAKLTPE